MWCFRLNVESALFQYFVSGAAGTWLGWDGLVLVWSTILSGWHSCAIWVSPAAIFVLAESTPIALPGSVWVGGGGGGAVICWNAWPELARILFQGVFCLFS